jgi:hypothetical protein
MDTGNDSAHAMRFGVQVRARSIGMVASREALHATAKKMGADENVFSSPEIAGRGF